ncbi:MAG: hypothetical protein WBE76_06800 [Terracidiphilus sp.]
MFTSNLETGSSLFSGINAPAPSFAPDFGGNRQPSFGSDLRGLVSAIQSGNSSGAQQFLSQIQKFVSTNANSNSPLSQFLSSVSSALSNNDIAGAQSALATFQSQRSHGPAAGTGTNGTGGTPGANGGTTTGGATGGATATLGQDVLALFTAIGSGNLQNAQSAYDNVTSLLLGGTSGSSPTPAPTPATAPVSSSTSTAAAPAASTVESSGNAPFASLLAQIGSALSTGDIDSAQTAVDTFLQNLSAGSLVGATV